MNEPLGEREVLCVSQFTLYGDARRGNRPSYVDAARPEHGRAALRARLRAARRPARRVRGDDGGRAGQRRAGDADARAVSRLPRPCRPSNASSAASPPNRPRRRCRTAPGPQTLHAEFLAACLRIDAEGQELGEARDLRWFPDRTWNGRTYIPVTARHDDRPRAVRLRLVHPRRPGGGGDRRRAVRLRHPRGLHRGDGGAQPRVADRHLRGGRGQLARRGRPRRRDDARLGHADDRGARSWPPPSWRASPSTSASSRDDRFTLLAPDNFRGDFLDVKLWDSRRARAGVGVALRRGRRGRRASSGLSGARSTEREECAGSPSGGSTETSSAAKSSGFPGSGTLTSTSPDAGTRNDPSETRSSGELSSQSS